MTPAWGEALVPRPCGVRWQARNEQLARRSPQGEVGRHRFGGSRPAPAQAPSPSLPVGLRHLVVSVLLGAGAAGLAPAREAPAAASPAPSNLLAHWPLDEPDGPDCRDHGPHGYHASSPAALARVEGHSGRAVRFEGAHRLSVPAGPDFSGLHGLSFSAWVMPGRFDRYNEIFRKEDGDRRVLFSFQEHGTVLSFGLNIGGYVECDARIKPEDVMDGRWHHCAATFDGAVMRVYLDGSEIGSLARPGAITAGGAAPGCIGSMNGNECFHGLMDDLRIYRDALPPKIIAAIHARDRAAEARYREQRTRQLRVLTARLRELLTPGQPFAATLAKAKQALAAQDGADPLPHADAAEAVARQLLAEPFPAETAEFSRLTAGGIVRYLTTADNSVCSAAIERLLGPMTESMPLTAAQWRRQPPEGRAKWRPIKALADEFAALRARGESSRFAPEWIELVLRTGRAHGPTVEERPRAREAVAPYVPPSTPETRTLAESEARRRLEQDWLHQADGNPTPARIRSEIEWTRELAARVDVDCAAELAELGEIEPRAAALNQADPELYFRVREIKRRIMFRNPVVDFDSVLFVDMPFPAGSEWRHETRHRLGYMAVPGGRLLVLDGLAPSGRLRQLMPQPPLHGAFWRPDLSYDGQRVLFCFHPHNEKSFHLYEIGIDGGGLRQLTDGPYDDLDPIYLPDGEHILFTSTRGHTYVRCMPPTNAFVLARCDRNGDNIYLISRNNEPDYLPSVLDDGRIVYTRWEYTDKPLWRAQGLWTAYPDGTRVNTLWGNQSVWPDLLKDARGIPGSRRIMFTGSAHHDWFAGSVGIIDPAKGFNFPDGLTKVTADVGWPESGNGPVDPVESPRYHRSGAYRAYYSPYPLGGKDFLVSAERAGKFVLYLMDVDGNRELVYEGQHHIFHAIPVKPRPRPRVLPDSVDWPAAAERLNPKNGILLSNNVYEGTPAELAGKARFLRVLTIEHKTYTYWHKRPYLSTGPVVSGVQSEGVKRVLGTVPVESDGSVAFHAPSGIPLHFQLLDGKYRALQTMRSFTGVMPGERRGCVGCHEGSGAAPPMDGPPPLALTREPSTITPPPWGRDTVSFERYVRPLLDRYCADCHHGDGKARKDLDLTPRPGHLGFDETYWLFTGRPSWGKPYRPPSDPPPGFGIAGMLMVEGYDQRDPQAYRTPEPMTRLSYRSRLVDLVTSGKHHDVKVDEISRRKLIAWIDAMCPYRGDEEIRQIDDPDFQGIDWLAIRPRVKTAPRITRPGPVE